MQDVTACLAY